MTQLSLPQNDDTEQQEQRQKQLNYARELYQWAHSHTYEQAAGQPVLAPIAVLKVDDEQKLPASQHLNLVQVIDIVDGLGGIVANLLITISNLVGAGEVRLDPPPPPPKKGGLRGLVEEVKEAVEDVKEVVEDVLDIGEHAVLAGANLIETVLALRELAQDIEQLAGKCHANLHNSKKAEAFADDSFGDDLKRVVLKLLELFIGIPAGLYGEASSLSEYAAQFQSLLLPDVAATWNTDEQFARMRIAGPNPLVIKHIAAFPEHLAIDAARFEKLTGLTPEAAFAAKRVYLADYAPLSVQQPGSFPQAKYPSAPLAVFVVDAKQTLKPVAIQCDQPDQETEEKAPPVFYPDDGELWELAKIHVQAADGNYHELISHLGLTHLVIEWFAVATHRQLADTHPLFRLLLPHFQGTMFINNSAITGLIAPEGTVDRLLAGTIESDWQVVVNALAGRFNDWMLPTALARRGVADPATFPDYPYRDDALLVWGAIENWVRAYVSHYYTEGDLSVVKDSELQNWVKELTSSTGANMNKDGFGEPPAGDPAGERGIYTIDDLVKVLTMVIFTSSAQHATVNFPQRTIMAYTPSMPLAAYAKPPEPGGNTNLFDHLPPLQQATVQLVLGEFLGGVYFTRLGDYDRHQPKDEPWFSDPDIASELETFQAALAEVERTIGLRNLSRSSYDVLLPSRIPQSINI